ncbi:MAG: hypothetical protein IJ646_10560 [Clostridia bacterium]|nr:hypothetical protein [Clostridia bacterium]
MKHSILMKKLRSRAGESIGETLVSLLISALALMMLAGAISAAMRVVTTSNDKMTTYYQGDNTLANPSVDSGKIMEIKLTDGTITSTYTEVPYYMNSAFSNKTAVTYVVSGEGAAEGSGEG